MQTAKMLKDSVAGELNLLDGQAFVLGGMRSRKLQITTHSTSILGPKTAARENAVHRMQAMLLQVDLGYVFPLLQIVTGDAGRQDLLKTLDHPLNVFTEFS